MPSLKHIAFSLLARPSILRANLSKSGTLILMFHGFRDQANQGLENHDGKHLLASSFDELLSKLARVVTFISLREYIEQSEQQKNSSKPSVILTFDDGYESNYQVAFPILQQHQVPATIFLATEFVTEGKQLWTNRLQFAFEHSRQTHLPFEGQTFSLQSPSQRIASLLALKKIFKVLPQENQDQRTSEIESSLDCRLSDTADSKSEPCTTPAIYRPLQVKQISEMAHSGLVDFGAHTHHHYILGRCEKSSIQAEIQSSQSKVAALTGKTCDLFCYPNGQIGDFNDTSRQLLQQNGFRCALTTVPGQNQAGCDPFTLQRFGISDKEPINWSLLEISGILAKLRSLRAS